VNSEAGITHNKITPAKTRKSFKVNFIFGIVEQHLAGNKGKNQWNPAIGDKYNTFFHLSK